MDKEKNLYTVLFAGAMVIVVGTILAYLASALSARIKENDPYG